MNPYRRAAFDWLTANSEKRWVKHSIGRVQALYQNAGQVTEAQSLRGQKPKRARPGGLKGVAKRAKTAKRSVPKVKPLPAQVPINTDPTDPAELRRVFDEQVRKNLEALAASELCEPRRGPSKVTLPDGSVIERK